MLRGLPLAVILVLAVGGCSAQTASDDDEITEAEYRQTVEAVRSCVEGRGFEAGEISLNSDGRTLGFNLGSGAEDPGGEKSIAAYDECGAEHGLFDMELAYGQQGRLTGKARDEAMVELVSCLEHYDIQGLSTAETDSRVFVKAISDTLGADTEDGSRAFGCMDSHRNVWPPGDANNP